MVNKLDSARTGLARVAGRWEGTRESALVAPVACVVYEAVFLTRYVSLLPTDYDPASFWLLVWCVAVVLACVFLRKRYPLGSVLAACACAAACAHVDEGAYTGIPLLVLLYGAVARAGYSRAVAAVLSVAAAFWAPVHLAGEETLALVHLEWMLAVTAAALVSRALWTRRLAAREVDEERAARERATRERDEAEERGRIAGELHDSVGHDLTAIVALSEGLMGLTGDETLEAAVGSINRLARDGLSDTRRAVRQLSALHGEGVAPAFGPHSWDDVQPVLGHARSAGLAVAFSETGTRSRDLRQSALAFAVTREAVTNALRHARAARRLTVSWDHARDGSCTVAVRDDGEPIGAVGSEGTGLARLRERVEAAGGRFAAGQSPDGGWEVSAYIPGDDSVGGTGEVESS